MWVRCSVTWSRSGVAETRTERALNSTRTQLVARAKRFGQLLLAIGENRLEFLLMEAQEGRERLLRAIMLILGEAVFGLLAAAALTGAIMVLLWEHSWVRL